jgi:predicted acylesterase/phospholipase RssA
MSAQPKDPRILAREILRGKEASLIDFLSLSRQLQNDKSFGYARRLLARARLEPDPEAGPKMALLLAQQHATCTYKDPDLPADARLERALDILRQVENLQQTTNQETLGIAGAIHKRKWEVDSRKQHLERALDYYLRGYSQGVTKDFGYTGINAALVLDLLADQEASEARESGEASQSATHRQQQAQAIRETIVREVEPLADVPGKEKLKKDFWFLATIAEAYFGLRRYNEAKVWLKRASEIEGLPPWQYEATARQLAKLATLGAENNMAAEALEATEAWDALQVFLKGNIAAVRTAFAGKVGLALSGGGFRASLFHIGMLARLAELDMLRHVEVLSCVSGGSIIGAHYYLEVRKLLEAKADHDITREDYIEIVKRVERDFLEGVQRNVRVRVIGHLPTNLRMMFDPHYSRTLRVGELYEREIYSRIKDGGENGKRWLNDLFIHPKGEPQGFVPKYDNWQRSAKVPILVLNATALNTGNNWQFTASWMGEPTVSTDDQIDGNYRLRRMYYSDAPEGYKQIRLGHAVAASSCVPGLFEPLVLNKLYPDKVVRLVDGGVHDNQGVGSLIEQDCTVLLVSDASGQMTAIDDPSASVLGVPLRSNTILMARVREAEYGDLVARRKSSLLRGLMFIHLKKDLQAPPVDWIDCEDPFDEFTRAEYYDLSDPNSLELTRYGILKKAQLRLSSIRTDLDSFSDVEAYALMTSAYRMTEFEFARSIKGFPIPHAAPESWRFLEIEKPMKQVSGVKAEHEALMYLLEVARNTAFKIWRISRLLRVVSVLLGIAAFIALIYACWRYWSTSLLTVGMITIFLATAAGTALIGKNAMRIVRFRETMMRVAISLVLLVVGWLLAGIHLLIFDRWFLRSGRISTIKESKS